MVVFFINILLIFSNIFGSDEIPETIARRTEKALKPIFKTETFNYELIEELEFTSLYKLNADSEFVGYLVYTSSKGRFERFQYMLLFSKDVEIIKVKILQYNSTRGTGVTSKRWLKQFNGNKGEELIYGKDIQAITGSTYSATSITHDIPLIVQWVQELVN